MGGWILSNFKLLAVIQDWVSPVDIRDLSWPILVYIISGKKINHVLVCGVIT